jgi:hypothetical protein
MIVCIKNSVCKIRNYFNHLKLLLLFFSLFPQLLWSQYLYNFEPDSVGGDHKCNIIEEKQIPEGRWICSSAEPISGNYSLRHNFDNTEPDCDYYVLSHDPFQHTDSLYFAFRVKHGYPPSSANNWQIIILAEYSFSQSDTSSPALEHFRIREGLMLGVNYKDSDDLIKLWEFRDFKCRELAATTHNFQEISGSQKAPEFSIEWYREGSLRIGYTADPDMAATQSIGEVPLASFPTGRNIIIRHAYTSARDQQLWIDDILMIGNFRRDTLPPQLLSAEVVDRYNVSLLFSETLLPTFPSGILLSGDGMKETTPDTLIYLDREVLLKFPVVIPNRSEMQLHITGLCDRDANCISDTIIVLQRNEAAWADLVINELMIDPSPSVLLPEKEFIEFFNRSGYELDLSAWKLDVNGRTFQLPEQKVQAGSYIVFFDIPLPNTGASLVLYDDKDRTIHSARYKIPCDEPDWKDEGGWSLESPDPEIICNQAGFWEFSSDPSGGTPGRINSNYREVFDQDPPRFLFMGFGEYPGSVVLHFSEPIKQGQWDIQEIKCSPGNLIPDSITSPAPFSEEVYLWYFEKLEEKFRFELHLPAPVDCHGNKGAEERITAGETSLPYGEALLINEIMFDPVDGTPEFLELYNPGTDYLDLHHFAIDIKGDSLDPAAPEALSERSRIILPQSYVVITSCIEWFRSAYDLRPSGQWVEVVGMGNLPNKKGIVTLTDRSGSVVDRVEYDDEMHLDLLGISQGISLERISPERSGSNPDSWHSASSLSGYATPGRKNSQTLEPSSGKDRGSVSCV